jgi:Cft2 family RNA processing exonuclease
LPTGCYDPASYHYSARPYQKDHPVLLLFHSHINHSKYIYYLKYLNLIK